MKANEFIKEYGLGEAAELVNSVKFVFKIKDVVCDPCFLIEDYAISYKELKRLVESHEIIQKDFESVEMADYEHMISGVSLRPVLDSSKTSHCRCGELSTVKANEFIKKFEHNRVNKHSGTSHQYKIGQKDKPSRFGLAVRPC